MKKPQLTSDMLPEESCAGTKSSSVIVETLYFEAYGGDPTGYGVTGAQLLGAILGFLAEQPPLRSWGGRVDASRH